MRIGDVLLFHGRRVILLGLEPMSVPDRRAHVRDLETGEVFYVALAELEAGDGLPPTA